MYSVKQVNDLEKLFLECIDYRMILPTNEYMKYYYLMRTFAQKNRKTLNLKPLDLATILRLQKTTNRAEHSLREIYGEPLNKSYHN